LRQPFTIHYPAKIGLLIICLYLYQTNVGVM